MLDFYCLIHKQTGLNSHKEVKLCTIYFLVILNRLGLSIYIDCIILPFEFDLREIHSFKYVNFYIQVNVFVSW